MQIDNIVNCKNRNNRLDINIILLIFNKCIIIIIFILIHNPHKNVSIFILI